MYTQLMGRVFNKSGMSYLVLNHDGDSVDWLWVRTVNAQRQLVRMHRDEIMSCLPELEVAGTPRPLRAGRAT